MNDLHLSDDRLIEICVSATAAPSEREHLAACTKCEVRRASVVQILQELDEAATVEADAAFPTDRLERQQARIFHRIEADGRPGRLITFPAGSAPRTSLLRSRPHVRWAAAAAAAAFVMGLLTGHLVHELPHRSEAAAIETPTDEGGTTPRAVPTTFSEDEFLGQVELAAGRTGPVALRPLDRMTPLAWEVR